MNKDQLIKKVATKYTEELDMESLVEAGEKGWNLATEKHGSSDAKFETYALWWVRAAIVERITGVSIPKIAQIEKLIEG